jgi:hypothetical protein
VHAQTAPSGPFHGLSSQVRGSLQGCYLRRCEGLFPPEKRKAGGSIPPLTTSDLRQRAPVILVRDERLGTGTEQAGRQVRQRCSILKAESRRLDPALTTRSEGTLIFE